MATELVERKDWPGKIAAAILFPAAVIPYQEHWATKRCPEHLLACLWVLEDSEEFTGVLPLVRRLVQQGCWAGLAWAVALAWSWLLPPVRQRFRTGEADLLGWLNSLLSFWPNVVVDPAVKDCCYD